MIMYTNLRILSKVTKIRIDECIDYDKIYSTILTSYSCICSFGSRSPFRRLQTHQFLLFAIANRLDLPIKIFDRFLNTLLIHLLLILTEITVVFSSF
jgi:hypothetical protein